MLDPIFEGLSYSGTYGAVWFAIAGALALAWRRPQLFAGTLIAVLLGFGASEALQALVGRSRPPGHTLVPRPHSHSFPSGHATVGFAAATVLAALVPRARTWFVLLAAAIAWSRVYVGVHYPLDVVAGAVLGVVLGFATVRGLPRLAAIRRRSPRSTRAG